MLIHHWIFPTSVEEHNFIKRMFSPYQFQQQESAVLAADK
jgi:hypothetical protein